MNDIPVFHYGLFLCLQCGERFPHHLPGEDTWVTCTTCSEGSIQEVALAASGGACKPLLLHPLASVEC